MLPYNKKVWATPLEKMDWRWIGERVSVIDLRRALRNIALEEDDVGWGPNNTFIFPKKGGTGAIFRAVADRLNNHIRYLCKIREVDVDRKIVLTADGQAFQYSVLLTTAPLDLFILSFVRGAPQDVCQAALKLEHNSVHVVGCGVDEEPDDLKCWMYFPESDFPFHRVTNFHNYSPMHVVKPGKQKALMAEVASSPYVSCPTSRLTESTGEAMREAGLLGDPTKIISTWEITADYGYPVPTLERDQALRQIHQWLTEKNIYSRGRFGGWKYEVGNMDHSFMQGVEWADLVVRGVKESIYRVE